MAQIIINNHENVKAEAEELITESAKIDSVRNSISYILDEINAYWEATQEDQQAFYSGLQSDVESLETIYACNTEFSNAIVEYMDVTSGIVNTTYGS